MAADRAQGGRSGSDETAVTLQSKRQEICLGSVKALNVFTEMQLERTDDQEFEAEAYQPKALMPFMKRVPAKRVVHLPEAARDPVEFSLSFNESMPLPQGISSTQLGNYHVTGVLLSRPPADPTQTSLPGTEGSICRLSLHWYAWVQNAW